MCCKFLTVTAYPYICLYAFMAAPSAKKTPKQSPTHNPSPQKRHHSKSGLKKISINSRDLQLVSPWEQLLKFGPWGDSLALLVDMVNELQCSLFYTLTLKTFPVP